MQLKCSVCFARNECRSFSTQQKSSDDNETYGKLRLSSQCEFYEKNSLLRSGLKYRLQKSYNLIANEVCSSSEVHTFSFDIKTGTQQPSLCHQNFWFQSGLFT